MKYTLLDMTQAILASLDGEEVNSINDTPESQQVAGVVRESYFELISHLNLPETFTLFEPEDSGDPNKPTLMYKPDWIQNIIWIKYDKRIKESDPPNYQGVTFLDLETFAQRMYNLGNDTNYPNDIVQYDLILNTSNTITIFGRTDRAPMYFTCFDDRTMIFDSYDSALPETTLMPNKTICYGEKVQEFLMEDTFTPNLDDKQFSLLLNEAKAQASVEYKQSQNPKAEQRARRGWVTANKKKYAVPDMYNYYMVKSPKYGRNPT